eukprot:m.146689 g.146689  ORF g.146689 m.146689 type:complete len:352 (-) comp16813_c2_seq2:170-1225(-)
MTETLCKRNVLTRKVGVKRRSTGSRSSHRQPPLLTSHTPPTLPPTHTHVHTTTPLHTHLYAHMAEISLPASKRRRAAPAEHGQQLVCPGSVVSEQQGYMRGHGTLEQGGQLVAVLAGYVEQINKVMSVRPCRSRYIGEIGDVVVGRITEVGQKRWKVDTQSRLDSVLKLSSVNLPGGVLRRKSVEDELMMREFFEEGDLISAEVQTVFQEDNALSLHTRSLKYGRLGPGSFLAVAPALIKRCKNHFHTLPCGVSVVIGNNGYIWIGENSGSADEEAAPAKLPPVSRDMRERIARVRNCIVALAEQSISIFDTSIAYTYEASEPFPVKDLLKPDVAAEITATARAIATASAS